MSESVAAPIVANTKIARTRGAERMARHRQRRRNGLRSVTIDLRETEIDQLIRCRLLRPLAGAIRLRYGKPCTACSIRCSGDAQLGKRGHRVTHHDRVRSGCCGAGSVGGRTASRG